MRFAHVLIFGFIVFSLQSKAFAYQPWQVVGGRYVSFQLPTSEIAPKSAVFREAARQTAKETQNCDLAAKIISRVFSRIVDENNLREYINYGPGLGLILSVSCSRDLAAGFAIPSRQPHAVAEFVVLNAHLVDFLNSEDEIAFLVGHEISHVILGHTRADIIRAGGLSIPIRPSQSRTKSQENQADVYGALMVANAGYNPYAVRAALDSVFSRYDFSLLRLEKVVDTYFDDGHGTNLERQLRVEDQIRSLAIPAGYKSSQPSAEFLKARSHSQAHAPYDVTKITLFDLPE